MLDLSNVRFWFTILTLKPAESALNFFIRVVAFLSHFHNNLNHCIWISIARVMAHLQEYAKTGTQSKRAQFLYNFMQQMSFHSNKLLHTIILKVSFTKLLKASSLFLDRNVVKNMFEKNVPKMPSNGISNSFALVFGPAVQALLRPAPFLIGFLSFSLLEVDLSTNYHLQL